MPEYYIGLMSGTSLDGVDAVLAAGRGGRLQLLDSAHLSYPSRLRERLLALHRSGNDELNRAALLANELSDVYASAVRRLLARAGVRARAVTAIGCHGQTVRHRPRAGYTTQLVDGARLAERTGIAVVCDFRSRDIAAEGEGAPLAPAYHHAVFGAARRSRAIVNVGGIANITRLPARGAVTGFDCGPGNCLLDAWVREKRRKPFDAHGAWAARGRVIPQLLKKLLAHPFFRRRPPKSTGRDDFELRWVRRFLSGRERAARRSLVGPHRDKIHLRVDGEDASIAASSGQVRSLLLALTQATLGVYREQTGNAAVALLDDLDSELDGSRSAAVCQAVAGQGQALVTSAHPEWASRLHDVGRVFRVSAGRVTVG